MISGRRGKALSNKGTLEICCEHHLTSPGSCSSEEWKLAKQFPLEIVGLILAQLAALGSQFAYSAALVHPRYSKSLRPVIGSSYTTFAHAKTTEEIQGILSCVFEHIYVLRLGDASGALKTNQPSPYFFDPYLWIMQSVKVFQVGLVSPPKHFISANPDELCLLQGYQYDKFITIFPNIKRLSLLNVGWVPLEAIHNFEKVNIIYLMTSAYASRTASVLNKTNNKGCINKALSMNQEYLCRSILGTRIQSLRRIYMVDIVETASDFFCAIEMRHVYNANKVKVAAYTVYCKNEWR